MDPDLLAYFHDMIPLEMCILDSGLNLIYANEALTKSTGIHDFSGRNMKSLIPEARLGTLQVLMEKSKRENREIRYRAEGLIGGEDREVILKYHHASQTFYAVLVLDSCQPRKENKDALTGLATREIFMERGGQLIHHAKRHKTCLAIIFMDLNGFKPVNDTYGHKAGDIVLKVISERLLATIRKTDTLARFGGDEFILGLSDLKAGIHASLGVRRLMKAVNEPIDIGAQMVSVSGSFGISVYPDDNNDLKTLIRYADEAMYQAKTRGLGYAFFSTPHKTSGEKESV
ncbi:GGDEF domain-containing protein [Desulfobotulus mexicanus]|uniref:GGDEF domain-containing protein n=1 Tax=Desulfobotulus mexicanus TaxID=2586642 RepID=A0A5Q4VIU4_9BACT|nr:GGDEF domain-containing protein [Desulfobotulus mexicanus]TYT75901.1 GGDEF domain-containing protein [Desulfobotulus mexicanus]